MAPYSFALELTPSALRKIVDCVPPERYAAHLETDRFNLTEMVAHMADLEDVLLDRMRLAHEKPGSTVELFDQSQRAVDKHYASRDLQHEMDVFENRRRDTMDFLRSLSEEDFGATFEHPQNGTMTVRDQLTMMLGHDLYHLEQASHYLR